MDCFVYTIETKDEEVLNSVLGVYRNYDDGNLTLKKGISIYRAVGYKETYNEEIKGQHHHVTLEHREKGSLDVEYVELNLDVHPLR